LAHKKLSPTGTKMGDSNTEDVQEVYHSDGDNDSADSSFRDDDDDTNEVPLNSRPAYYDNTETHSAWRSNVPYRPASYETDSEEEEEEDEYPTRVRFIQQGKAAYYHDDEEEEEDEEEDEIDDEGGELTPDKERKIMRKLELNQPALKKGDLWYIVEIGWYQCWKQYTKVNDPTIAARPGPIDNNSLLQPGTQMIKLNITENISYVIISQEQWNKLYSWYIARIFKSIFSTST
jgi:hypothetical protein